MISLPSFALILPLLLGVNCLAEEHRQGMWDWQLSLPCSRSRQWFTKLLVAIVLFCMAFALFSAFTLLLSIAMKHPTSGWDISYARLWYMAVKLLPLSIFMLACGAVVSLTIRNAAGAFFVSIGVVLFICWIPAMMLGGAGKIELDLTGVLRMLISRIWPFLALAGVMAWFGTWHFRFERLAGKRLLKACLAFILGIFFCSSIAWLAQEFEMMAPEVYSAYANLLLCAVLAVVACCVVIFGKRVRAR